jgi:hypothetical protein
MGCTYITLRDSFQWSTRKPHLAIVRTPFIQTNADRLLLQLYGWLGKLGYAVSLFHWSWPIPALHFCHQRFPFLLPRCDRIRTLFLTEYLTGSQTQKGVASYAMSPNRQKPLAGAAHAAIFNTFRRTRQQFLYWVPPLVAAYFAMEWAIEK